MWMDLFPSRRPRKVPSRREINRRRQQKARRRLFAESLEDRRLLTVVGFLGNLEPPEGFVLASAVPQDQVGKSVSSAGDINHDGFDDVLIGAPVDDNFLAGNGAAYLIYGKQDGFANSTIELVSEPDGFPLYGLANKDFAGFSVSDGGDINGDGFHDFIIGAPGGDRPHPYGQVYGNGETYVVFGGEFAVNSRPTLFSLNGSNGFKILGNAAYDRVGNSVSSAGDVNGDGFDDLLIGAPFVDQTYLNDDTGRSYLLFGKADGFSATVNVWQIESNGDGLVFNGIDPYDLSGFSVSDAGDINGDGYGDFAIGAPFADKQVFDGQLPGSGEGYLIFGGPSIETDVRQLDGTNGFRVAGFATYDRAGYSVSAAGDVNGDGIDDLLISAPADQLYPVTPGQTYVVFGKTNGFDPVVDLGSLDGTNGFSLFGIDGADHAGWSVSGGGDVNGDGFDDLLIGAPFGDQYSDTYASYGVGEAYVVFGRDSGFPNRVILGALGDDEGFHLIGENPYARTGFSVSDAGDVNGDGFDDFIIGAPTDYYYSGRPGRAYVIFGRDFTGKSPQAGDENDNTLIGTAAAEVQIGGQGDDLLMGNGGADVARGAQGDDTIFLTDLSFRLFDGGRGNDTLKFSGAGLHLDLSATLDNRLVGFENIDLTGSGDNQLTIGNVREVLNLSDTSNRLVINRDAGDTVDIGTGWAETDPETIDGTTYRVFTQGAATLLVENLKPVVDLNGPDDVGSDSMATFTEDGPGVVIVEPDLTIGDDDQITSATVTITNLLDGADESLAMSVGGTGLQTTYNSTTGVLRVTGRASASVYTAVLATLTYHNADDGADTTDRIVTVTVDDGLLSSDPVQATIGLVAVNDAPQLAGAPVQLSTITEDTLDPPGTSVSALIPDGNITDPDGAAVEAIAVILVDQTNGLWQYSTGGGWMEFGTPSVETARLLGPTDQVRFVPNADFNGTASFRFKAWDQSAGNAGDEANVTAAGGTTPFSIAKTTATISVSPVNDAPILDDTLSPTLTSISRDQVNSPGDLVSTIVTGAITDIDGQPIPSIAVIATDELNGHWEQLRPGTTLPQWMRITASESSATLLSFARRVRFVPNIGFTGTATLTFRAWDQSAGVDGGQADTRQNGGMSAFSVETDTVEVTVSDTDDPPTLDPIASPLILGNLDPFSVELTNITDGGARTETLTVSAVSSNHSVLPDPAIVYTSPSTTGQATLAPVAAGWSIVTVTVTEGDGDTISRSFAVSAGDNPQAWQNPFESKDVNTDGVISPNDVLVIINELNNRQFSDETGRLPIPTPPGTPPPYYDVTGDGFVTPRDALVVINCLNSGVGGEGEAGGEGEGASHLVLNGLPPTLGSNPQLAPASTLAVPQSTSDRLPRAINSATPSVVGELSGSTAAARQRIFAARSSSLANDDLESILETLGADVLTRWWS